MLDPESVDLDALGTALDDRTPYVRWFIDTGTGETVGFAEDGDDDPEDHPGDLRRIEPAGSHEGYQDMAQFVAAVHHRRAADLLDRAISGRGAFRRFKDTLFEFPELREQWFRYREARSRRRALRWLADEELITPADAERLAARHPDPTTGDEDLAAAVAVDLAMLHGDRLRQVHAVTTGEHELTLVVVLDDLRAPWDELRRMDDLLWRHTERSGVAVSALPVGPDDLAARTSPLLARMAAEGRVVS